MSSVPATASGQVQRLQDELLAMQRRLQAVANCGGTLLGKLEFELRQDDQLLLAGADARADQLLGKPCAAFFGQTCARLFSGFSPSDLDAALRKVAHTGDVLEHRSLLGEGVFAGKSLHLFAFQLAHRRVVVKFWDGTGPAQAEKTDMHLQQQVEALFALSPLAISLSCEQDGRYVDVNAEWSRLTGFSLQDVLGRTAIDIGFWTDAVHRDAVLQSLRQQGHLRNLDMSFVRADGAKLVLQLTASRIEIGGAFYILSYFKDVTLERKLQAESLANEQLLQATNKRLSRQIELFESIEGLAAVGHWTAGQDAADLCWSNGLYRLAGLEPGTVLDSRTGRSGIHAQDRQHFEEARTRMDGETIEFRWHHPDGRTRWLRSRMKCLSDDGAGSAHFGVVQDVTNERVASLALQEKLQFIPLLSGQNPNKINWLASGSGCVL